MTAHWIDESKGEHCSHTLACSKFKKRHFATNYEEEIRNVVAKFDLMLPNPKNVTNKTKKKKKISEKRKYSDAFPVAESDDETERSSKRYKPQIVHGCAGD